MTSRERLLAVLRGQPVDKIPWAPFLTYWWDQNLIEEAEGLGEIGFKKAVGADLLMRGHGDRLAHNQYKDLFMFKNSYGKTKIEETINGNKKQVKYETPVGTLQAGYRYSPEGDTWFLMEHPVKAAEDFRILKYIAEDTILEAYYEPFLWEQKKNPDALFVPLITPFTKTGFQSMIEFWVGTEELCYLEADENDAMKSAMEAMRRTSMEGARISAASPAEVFMSWEDTSTTNVSPSWYESYILPEINEWCEILHEKSKLYSQHACGHLRHLLPLIGNSKIDAIESVSAPPTGNIPFAEAMKMLPEHIAVIGGIEPVFFINSNKEELENHIDMLCDTFKGRRFILANADSCPPQVDIDKFGIVSSRIHKRLGLQAPDITVFDKSDCIKPRGVSGYHGSPSNITSSIN
jgi:uroporphyrinogen-III decarboxylase